MSYNTESNRRLEKIS